MATVCGISCARARYTVYFQMHLVAVSTLAHWLCRTERTPHPSVQ